MDDLLSRSGAERIQRIERRSVPEEKNAPGVVIDGCSPEFRRRLKEVENRLVRDRAGAGAEIEVLEKRLELLRSSLSELERQQEELKALEIPGLRSEKELNSLLEQVTLRYFRTSGGMTGMGRSGDFSASSAGERPAEVETLGKLMFRNLPYFFSLIAAVLLLAGALALIFC